MHEVGYILLGWLLGVLSPLITRHGERNRRKKEIGEGLRAELSEFRVRLAGMAFLVTLRFGTFDRAFIKWLLPLFQSYRGAHPTKEFRDTLEKLSGHSDAEIQTFAVMGKANEDRALSLKRFVLPYLEANMGNLDLFSERAKLLALEVSAQVAAINEETEQVRFYYGLTFDSSLTTRNHEIVNASIASSSLNVCRTGREVLAKLDELERELS